MRGTKIARATDPQEAYATRSRNRDMLDGQEARPYGYHGLACIIAVPWDTQFSPIDVRTLAARRPAPAVVNGPRRQR